MPDSVLLEVARQVPYAVILFGFILLFLNYLGKLDDKRIAQDAARMAHDKEMEEIRINAAKEREAEKRVFDAQTNNIWANGLKEIQSKQETAIQMLAQQLKETAQAFAGALSEHERSSKDRYDRYEKKFGITQDLLEAAKEQFRKK